MFTVVKLSGRYLAKKWSQDLSEKDVQEYIEKFIQSSTPVIICEDFEDLEELGIEDPQLVEES